MFGLRWLETWEFWAVIKSDDLLNDAESRSVWAKISWIVAVKPAVFRVISLKSFSHCM
jgi:hypothetical protein